MKFIRLLLLFILGAFTTLQAQDKKQGPAYIGTADSLIYVPSLSSKMDQLTPSRIKPPREAGDARSFHKLPTDIVPGRGMQADILSKNPDRLSQKIPGRAPDLVWTAATSNSQPTDPSIAVGPNHIIAVFNTGFAIYDKNGNTLIGQTAPNPAIFTSGGCCDLTASYDPMATSASNPVPGRWILTFLNGAGAGAQIAVSDGPDPVTAGWNNYLVSTINDYQKLSVWSDGYYMTDQSSGNRVYALERQAMLDGEPASNVSIQGFTLPNFNNFGFASLQALNIADDQYPGPGNATVVFFQDDAYIGQSDDSIKFWDLDVDFDTPGNSTISTPQEIIVTPFTSIFDNAEFDNLTQPGGQDIDALQGIIMNQAQYKKFPTYESAIFNFVIDVNPAGVEQAAIRWYEFRRSTPTSPWVMEQEGTFADPDGKHFWNASMIMDTQGNIGMGFTAMGNASTGNGTANEFVSSYYTGRLAGDPSGTMTIAPQLIAAGTGNIPGSDRYGDYSKIDLDPVDYKRMYFNNELMFPGRRNVIGRFQIAPNITVDAGIIDIIAPVDGDLSAPQNITVTVRNFGTNSISNVPVSYTIDGGSPVNENVTGPIASGASVDFTFSTQADLSIAGQTYTIASSTGLTGDEDPSNDSFSIDVLHTAANDTGVTQIIEPTTGNGLTNNENVIIEISNFGTSTQTSIPVFYSVNGSAPVQETFTGSIASGSTDTFTFSTPADLSSIGSYNFIAGTELIGDADNSNDNTTDTVSNTSCIPTSNCQDFNDGVTQIQLADQAISTNCSASGYSDDTNIVFTFNLTNNPFTGTLQMGWEDSEFALWIDFDDDGIFTSNELVANDLVAVANTDFNFSINFDNFPNATTGTHLMRLRGEDESGTGDVTNPCDDLQFGRTNDYTAVINNISCFPSGDCQGFNDGVTQIQLADQAISTNCSAGGYSNDTDIVFTFDLSNNPFNGTLQMGWEDSEFALWIDFDDDGVFDTNELVANDLVAVADTDFNFSINFDDFPNATTGTHLMRLRGEDEDGTGDVTNPCDDLQFGRTNDYTAIIVPVPTQTVSGPWNDPANWTDGVVPTANDNAIIFDNVDSYLTQNQTVNSLTLNPGSTLSIPSSDHTLDIKGDITNNGDFTLYDANQDNSDTNAPIGTNGNPNVDGELLLSGNSTQKLLGTGNYYNLRVDNINGVDLENSNLTDPTEINGILTVANGNFSTNDNILFPSYFTEPSPGDFQNGSYGQIGPLNGTISGQIKVEQSFPGRRAFRIVSSSATSTTSIQDNWQENATAYNTFLTNATQADGIEYGFGTHITGVGEIAGSGHSSTNPSPSDQTDGLDWQPSGNASMFEFDDANQQFNPVLVTEDGGSPESAVLVAGKPYFIMIRGSREVDLQSNTSPTYNTKLRSFGTAVKGDVTVNSSASSGGYLLIGNPFHAIVDMTKVVYGDGDAQTTADNNPGINRFMYAYDPTQGGESDVNNTSSSLGGRGRYVTIDLQDPLNTISSSQMNQFLQAYQGVFLRAQLANPTLVFSEDDKAVGDEQIDVFSSLTDKITIRLYDQDAYSNNGSVDDIIVIKFGQNENNGVDFDDALKFHNPDENLARNEVNSLLSYENRAMPQIDEILELYINNYRTTNYTFVVDALGLSNNSAYLFDNYTNTETLLDNDASTTVSFNVDVSNPESIATNRFEIRFETSTLGTDEFDSLGISVYPNPASDILNINLGDNIGRFESLKLFDINGRLIVSKSLDNQLVEVQLKVNSLSSGVYVLKVSSGNEQFSTKVIVD